MGIPVDVTVDRSVERLVKLIEWTLMGYVLLHVCFLLGSLVYFWRAYGVGIATLTFLILVVVSIIAVELRTVETLVTDEPPEVVGEQFLSPDNPVTGIAAASFDEVLIDDWDGLEMTLYKRYLNVYPREIRVFGTWESDETVRIVFGESFVFDIRIIPWGSGSRVEIKMNFGPVWLPIGLFTLVQMYLIWLTNWSVYEHWGYELVDVGANISLM